MVLVQLDESTQYGVTRDVSERGLLIATRSLMKVGDRLEVAIHDRAGVVRAKARVVRVEDTPPEEAWRYRVALELDEPLPSHVVENGTKAAARFLPSSSPPPRSAP